MTQKTDLTFSLTFVVESTRRRRLAGKKCRLCKTDRRRNLPFGQSAELLRLNSGSKMNKVEDTHFDLSHTFESKHRATHICLSIKSFISDYEIRRELFGIFSMFPLLPVNLNLN